MRKRSFVGFGGVRRIVLFLLAKCFGKGRHRPLADTGRLHILTGDGLVDLFAMDGHGLRSVDAELNLIPLHIDNGDFDTVTDDNALVFLSTEDQHIRLVSARRPGGSATSQHEVSCRVLLILQHKLPSEFLLQI